MSVCVASLEAIAPKYWALYGRNSTLGMLGRVAIQVNMLGYSYITVSPAPTGVTNFV
jgi:hypothetical protein